MSVIWICNEIKKKYFSLQKFSHVSSFRQFNIANS